MRYESAYGTVCVTVNGKIKCDDGENTVMPDSSPPKMGSGNRYAHAKALAALHREYHG